ncbi:MAG: hypothetical protein IKE43_01235 [Coriobacteriales bacterium]|nr:hypothetical protein [Coriobacteriales bacterium]
MASRELTITLKSIPSTKCGGTGQFSGNSWASRPPKNRLSFTELKRTVEKLASEYPEYQIRAICWDISTTPNISHEEIPHVIKMLHQSFEMDDCQGITLKTSFDNMWGGMIPYHKQAGITNYSIANVPVQIMCDGANNLYACHDLQKLRIMGNGYLKYYEQASLGITLRFEWNGSIVGAYCQNGKMQPYRPYNGIGLRAAAIQREYRSYDPEQCFGSIEELIHEIIGAHVCHVAFAEPLCKTIPQYGFEKPGYTDRYSSDIKLCMGETRAALLAHGFNEYLPQQFALPGCEDPYSLAQAANITQLVLEQTV